MLKGALAGAIGSLAGSLVMERFQALWTSVGERLAPKEEHASGESDPATVRMAERISEAVAHEPLATEAKPAAGEVVHYTMGVTTAATYGLVAELIPAAALGWGLPFGALVWLGADELLLWKVGLAEKPVRYPASSHAYGLASHLVYGLATEVVRRVVRGLLR